MPRQNAHHFPEDIIKWIFLNESIWISIKISLNFDPKGLIKNISALVQVMAWCRPGDKPLSKPMMVSPLTHASLGLNELGWGGVEGEVWGCWPLKIGPQKIKARREFGAKKMVVLVPQKIILVLVNYMRHTLWC